jgi:hypothetical protein
MRLRLFVLLGMTVLVEVASNGRWLSIRQLSQRLQVPVSTLRAWRASGYGPPGTKLGASRSSSLRYWLPDVEAWEQAEREAARQAEAARARVSA